MALIRRDKETTLEALTKFLKTNDREVLDSVYEEYKDVFPQTPWMTAAEIKAVLDVAKSPKAKQLNPEDFFDNALVQKNSGIGFYRSYQ